MTVAMDDPDSEDTELWRRILEQLLAGGASRAEALDGANLMLAAYQRRRHAPRGGTEAFDADEESDE